MKQFKLSKTFKALAVMMLAVVSLTVNSLAVYQVGTVRKYYNNGCATFNVRTTCTESKIAIHNGRNKVALFIDGQDYGVIAPNTYKDIKKLRWGTHRVMFQSLGYDTNVTVRTW